MTRVRERSFEDGFRNFDLSNQKTRDAVTGMQETWGRGRGFWQFFGGGMLNLRSKCRGHEVSGREDRKQDAKEHEQFIKIESAAFIIKRNNTLHVERLQYLG